VACSSACSDGNDGVAADVGVADRAAAPTVASTVTDSVEANKRIDDALEVLEEFDATAGNVALAALNVAVVRDPAAIRQAALAELGSEDTDVRFAAAYGLAAAGVEAIDGPVVETLLEDDDEILRLLGAQALARAGIGRGVPVLISLLSSQTALPHSDGMQVWQAARRTLLDITDQDLGLEGATDAVAAGATIPAWETWWAANESSFVPIRPEPVFG
jgi:HEAT repeat protein